jgi:hypothetical protein
VAQPEPIAQKGFPVFRVEKQRALLPRWGAVRFLPRGDRRGKLTIHQVSIDGEVKAIVRYAPLKAVLEAQAAIPRATRIVQPG